MTSLSNPVGAHGYTDLQTRLWKEEALFETSAAVTARSVVAIGTDGRVATAATNGDATSVVGIARRGTTAAGKTTGVVVKGIAEDVLAQGAIAAGALVIRSATSAGHVASSATPAAGTAIGVAISAASGGTVDIWVK
jgi:hypothetical protein